MCKQKSGSFLELGALFNAWMINRSRSIGLANTEDIPLEVIGYKDMTEKRAMSKKKKKTF